MRTLYVFSVMGKGNFPTDMLRYDCCWPARSDDAVAMQLPVELAPRREIREVRMNSYQHPTEARWASFLWGCKVLESRHVEVA